MDKRTVRGMSLPMKGDAANAVHPFANGDGIPNGDNPLSVDSTNSDLEQMTNDAEAMSKCGACGDNDMIPAELVFAGHAFVIEPVDNENLPPSDSKF